MNETNPIINILCAADENYVPYCGIMLTSLLMNNRNERFRVFIMIEDELTKRSRLRFSRLIEPYNATIEYVKVDKSLFERYPTRNLEYWSLAMYYRILAAQVLPNDVEKVLYLDCDIIVNGSLRSLFDIDISNEALGVVPDVFIHDQDLYKRLDYPQKYGYFNSGVLLINLKYWRENCIIESCFSFLSSYYETLMANDQDLLNAVLYNQKCFIPLTSNYQIQFLKKNFFYELKEYQQEIVSTKEEGPIVVHYAFPIKPWQVLYYKMPYKQLWRRYKWKSQWWYLLPQLPKHKTVNYLIKRFVFWPLGIMYTEQYVD